jgi:hypothetical protein
MDIKLLRTITVLSILLAVSLSVVSFSGAFLPGTYKREVPSMAAQGTGQDLVDLFLVVPLLILSLVLVRRKVKAALFLFGGTVFYIVYSFVIYAFGVHFNSLFFLYCSTLGLSLYLFILVMSEAGRMEVEGWFGPGLPVRPFAVYVVLVAAIFYVLWLRDTVPAVFRGSVPSTVSNYGLLVNPVHVLDMAVALPGLVVTAFLLLRKRRLGYVLAPMALVFLIILAVALMGMVLTVNARGIGEDSSVAGIFAVLAVISTVFLVLFLKKMKTVGNVRERAEK